MKPPKPIHSGAARRTGDNRSKARLIITADDGGVCASIDHAIVSLARAGTITNIAAFSNFNLLPSLAAELNGLCKLSIHLSLTSGVAVSDPKKIRTLVNGEGKFFEPLSFHKPGMSLSVPIERFGNEVIPRFRAVEICREFLAQIEKFIDIVGYQPVATTVHHDLDRFENIASAIAECGLVPQSRQLAMKTGRLSGFEYQFAGSNESKSDYEKRLSALIENAIQKSTLKEGAPYEIALHPSLDDSQLSSFTAYCSGRVKEFAAWSSSDMIKRLRAGKRRGGFLEFLNIGEG